MLSKRLVCPARVRRVPKQFSWVDQRLVREHYVERCDAYALALYLFLVTVADDQGLSYYADATLSARLSMNGATLNKARQTQIGAQLIAYERPFYQVLAWIRLASSASAGRASFSRCERYSLKRWGRRHD
jgi:hypothetical protein